MTKDDKAGATRIKPIGVPIPEGCGEYFMLIWCCIGLTLPFLFIWIFL